MQMTEEKPKNKDKTIVSEGFYTKENIAEMLQVDVRTVERYIEKSGLPSYKIQGKTRIKISDFNNWVENFKR